MENLLSASKSELREYIASVGGNPVHAHKVLAWIHKQGAPKSMEIEGIGKALAKKISQRAPELPFTVEAVRIANDGTRKYLLRLSDSHTIEMVLIPSARRTTLCVSSQVGCALNCAFCATGKQGFSRNLNKSEIIAQLWLAQNLLALDNGRPVSNVVFMGMGEPLLNFDAVMESIDLMLDDNAYGLSHNRVTISTVGHSAGIRRLAQHKPSIGLTVSLHAPDDGLRNQLVPINKKYPLQDLLAACDFYLSKTNAQKKITFAYTLLENINDSIECAHRLAHLLSDFPAKINLIPFNTFPDSSFSSTSESKIDLFRRILSKHGLVSTVRRPRGMDIAAACGQLTMRNESILNKSVLRLSD